MCAKQVVVHDDFMEQVGFVPLLQTREEFFESIVNPAWDDWFSTVDHVAGWISENP